MFTVSGTVATTRRMKNIAVEGSGEIMAVDFLRQLTVDENFRREFLWEAESVNIGPRLEPIIGLGSLKSIHLTLKVYYGLSKH